MSSTFTSRRVSLLPSTTSSVSTHQRLWINTQSITVEQSQYTNYLAGGRVKLCLLAGTSLDWTSGTLLQTYCGREGLLPSRFHHHHLSHHVFYLLGDFRHDNVRLLGGS